MIQILINKKLFLQTSKKSSDVVDNEVGKNTKLNMLKTKVNSLEKIPDATNLININQYNTDKQKKLEMLVKKYQI